MATAEQAMKVEDNDRAVTSWFPYFLNKVNDTFIISSLCFTIVFA